MTPLRSKLEEILGIYRVSPHASPDGVTFDEPRCGDCFCTTQEVHTHSFQGISEKKVDQIIQAITELIDEAQPEKKSESSDPDVNLYYETGNYDDTYEIGKDVGFNQAIDKYKSNLLKGVRE